MPAKSKLKIKTRKHLTRSRTDHFADGWRYLFTDSNACMIFLFVGGTGFFSIPSFSLSLSAEGGHFLHVTLNLN